MGTEIGARRFDERAYERFGERLREGVRALGELLERPGFGLGETTIGAELELHLVDARARPALVNRAVLEDMHDARVTFELARFNLEVNADPSPIAGRPFTALCDQLTGVVAAIRRAASTHGARVVAIGILPTIVEDDLVSSALTDTHRFAALSAGIERARRGRTKVRIHGDDRLELDAEGVSLEAVNTSFQIHLRVAPDAFARTYNAAQLATGPALALATNSPLFLGRRLWDETRIPLVRQSVEDRPNVELDDWRPSRVSFGHGWVRRSAVELFAEVVAQHEPLLPVVDEGESPMAVVAKARVPRLQELRLHSGTVWRWNRPVYDDAGGGHLRIEMRALPAGPTVIDMVAGAAFALGLTLGLAANCDDLVTRITFGQARRNFYRAARYGIGSELVWPDASRARLVEAPELITSLLPIARAGLCDAGVAREEAERWLAIVADRALRRITGARWQRAVLDSFRRRGYDAGEASRAMLERYMSLAEEGHPLTEWPSEAP